MSGDVQPRKRKKDPKRKKDSDSDPMTRKLSVKDEDKDVTISGVKSLGTDDVQMHVQKDQSTGGHWCAKIVFFALMAILAGLIGLIIMENRGLSDLDTPLSESRYSEILEGWVEENRESHDEHDILEGLNELDDHDHDDEPFEEVEDHDDDDEEAEEHSENDHDEEDDDDQDENGDTAEDHDDDDDDENDNATNEEDVAPADDDNDTQEENDDNDDDDDDDEPIVVQKSKRSVVQNDDDEDDGQSLEEKTIDSNHDDGDDDDQDDENNTQEIEDVANTQEDTREEIDDDDDNNAPFEETTTKPHNRIESVDQLAAQVTEMKRLYNDLLKSEETGHRMRRRSVDRKLPDDDDDEDDNDHYRRGHDSKQQNNGDDDDDEEDGTNSYEKVVDNDEGEELHLKKISERSRGAGDEDTGNADSGDAEEDENADSTASQVPHPYGGGAQENSDEEIRMAEDLRQANQMLEDNPVFALNAFEAILLNNPNSTEALLGRAKALDKRSTVEQDNQLLMATIEAYERVLRNDNGATLRPEDLKGAAQRCLELIKFIGKYQLAIPIHEMLITRFPDDPDFRVQLAMSYFYLNDLAKAKYYLHEIVLRWRYHGHALVLYGYVLAQLDKEYEEAAVYFAEGMSTEEGRNASQDGTIFTTWGETLQRLGRQEEAMAVFKRGAKLKLFPSMMQRSLYNVNDLEAKPFWTVKETGVKLKLEIVQKNWHLIREEAEKLLDEDGYFIQESERLLDAGDWKQLVLFGRGQKMTKNCERAPLTCKIIETFPEARFCRRGQVKFSILTAGTHIWPHCGPTNCRLRAHLGLRVPTGTSIRVANETRSWQEGEFLVFDDSFEHEVWHAGSTSRLVLIVDIWHPDLNEYQREHLSAI